MTPEEWNKINCPTVWKLLNNKAKSHLPNGLRDYIYSGNDAQIEAGKENLLSIDLFLAELERSCGEKEVADKYSKSLSKLKQESQFSELFCEIALCAFLAKESDSLHLRPPTGKGTYSDCIFNMCSCEVFGEVKRYVDPWPPIRTVEETRRKPILNRRSISKTRNGKKPKDTARPRSMDLRKKLCDVYKQFPDEAINILFLFHSSFGESQRYITQALCGDRNFFRDSDEYQLEDDGLFSRDEWRNISSCCLVRYNRGLGVGFSSLWLNPNANNECPVSIIGKIKLWLEQSKNNENIIN
jgi:hypothetical protein